MIYVLHGDDLYASYNRLSELVYKYQILDKLRLDSSSKTDDFYMAVLAQDLVTQNKVIIGEDLIRSKKISPLDLKKIPSDKIVILWEKWSIPQNLLLKINRLAKIEVFKLKPVVFQFLDSLRPNSKNFIRLLYKFDLNKDNILWHLANRIQLLILASLDLDHKSASEITEQHIQDWQWSKISAQSKSFDTIILKQLYKKVLKLDFLIKKGQLVSGQHTPVLLTFLKYLKIT